MASGEIAFSPTAWHTLKLRCFGVQLTAFIDNTQVAQVTGIAYRSGMIGIGTGGWYEADFDNLRVEKVTGTPPELHNLALGAKATASSVWSDEFAPFRANDNQTATRWNAAKGKLAENGWNWILAGKFVWMPCQSGNSQPGLPNIKSKSRMATYGGYSRQRAEDESQ